MQNPAPFATAFVSAQTRPSCHSPFASLLPTNKPLASGTTTIATSTAATTLSACFPSWKLHRFHYHNFRVCCRSALRTAVRTTALLHGSEPAPGRPARL